MIKISKIHQPEPRILTSLGFLQGRLGAEPWLNIQTICVTPWHIARKASWFLPPGLYVIRLYKLPALNQTPGMLTSLQWSPLPRNSCYYSARLHHGLQCLPKSSSLNMFLDPLPLVETQWYLYPHWIPESKNILFFFFLPPFRGNQDLVHRPQIIVPWNTSFYPVKGWDAFEKDLHGVFTPEKRMHAQTLILKGVNKFPNVLPGLRNPTKVCVCVCVLSHSIISSSLWPFEL